MKFFLLFIAGCLVLMFFLYPIDDFLPWFSAIFPMFKHISIFEFLKSQDNLVTIIIFGSILSFVVYKAYQA